MPASARFSREPSPGPSTVRPDRSGEPTVLEAGAIGYYSSTHAIQASAQVARRKGLQTPRALEDSVQISKHLLSVSTLAWALASGPGAASASAAFADLKGETLLDNSRVHVEKFVLRPGQSTGAFRHQTDQLLVFTKGGILKSTSGRATLWKDGRVLWRAGSAHEDAPQVNGGSADIEMLCVSLKRVAAAAGKPTYQHLNYPNIPGEDILENDSVIVQRFTVNPGQWEGVHAHHPNMLWIHIKGGQWAARTKTEPEHPYPHISADGSVGWMDPVDLSVGHESRNIGNNPIDLIWVTFKK